MNVSEYFDKGTSMDCTHVIIVHDVSKNKDFAIYVEKEDNIDDTIKLVKSIRFNRVREVYNLSQDKQEQIEEEKTWRV